MLSLQLKQRLPIKTRACEALSRTLSLVFGMQDEFCLEDDLGVDRVFVVCRNRHLPVQLSSAEARGRGSLVLIHPTNAVSLALPVAGLVPRMLGLLPCCCCDSIRYMVVILLRSLLLLFRVLLHHHLLVLLLLL